MAIHRTAEALRQLGEAARLSGLTDAALLAQFAAARDQTAFAELVRRHGPLVFGVCLRTAGHRQDAEDAFQATFLVLAAKAAAVADPGLLGNWLYGVAYRVARKARRAAARRRGREVQVATFPDPPAPSADPTPDFGPALDAALAGLPAVYRVAIVLCDLQQKSRAEAAAMLGIPEGTLSSRLANGRKKLADRLARRGVTAAIGAALGTTAVPPDLAAKTVEAATAWAAGGVVAAHLRSLMSDGGPVMWKATGVIAAAVAAVGLAVGAAAAWPGANPDEPAKPSPAKAEPMAKAGEDGEKPANGTKPRLLASANLEGTTALPVWSADGSMLAVTAGRNITIYDGRTLRALLTFPTGEVGTMVGFTREKPALVTYLNGPRRINSTTQLRFWELPRKDAGGAWIAQGPHLARATELDASDGHPFAISADGKVGLTVTNDRKQKAADEQPIVTSTRFRALDAGSGEVIKEVATVEGLTTGFAASPDGRRLVVLSRSEKGQLEVACLDVESGKPVWSQSFAKRAEPGELVPDLSTVSISPDGTRLSVNAAMSEYDPTPSGPGALSGAPPGTSRGGGNPFLPKGKGQRPTRLVGRVFLLDMTAGNPYFPPEGTADESWIGLGFSHDGKLFVGRSGPGRSDSQLRVWEVRSGKVLKTWEGSADAAFAPDRPTLAILEHYQELPPATDLGGRRQLVNKASLGLWDLSALLK